MTETNYYDYQAYGTQVGEMGTTNVLPTIQGNTEVLPPIGGDFGTTFVQGENTILQDTAGLGTTTTTGYFGTTDANTIYGTTQEYPATTYGGEQVFQTTAQPTTFYGETQVTTDNNAFLTGVTTTDNTALYGAAQYPTVINDGTALKGGNQVLTDTYATQGATQLLPATNVDANTFFAGATAQIPQTVQNTTTTTQTTYGVTGFSPSPIQTTLGTTTQIPTPTTNQANTLGVGTKVPVNAQTLPPQNANTNVKPGAVVQNQNIQYKARSTAAQIQDNSRKSNKQKIPGGKVYDEDFRRGRPIYNDKYTGSKYEMPRLMKRPVYNTGLNNQGRPSKIEGVNQVNPLGVNKINNVGLGGNLGLNKLAKGVSYDVYGRGITPILNKAGLGQINDNKIKPVGQ